MVLRMDALFVADRKAGKQKLTGAGRLEFRRRQKREWVEEIKQTCKTPSRQALPQSTLGKAVTYTFNMWTKLERFVEYEEVELSNKLAENVELIPPVGHTAAVTPTCVRRTHAGSGKTVTLINPAHGSGTPSSVSQNLSFNASCMSRGSLAWAILPKPAPVTVVLLVYELVMKSRSRLA